MYIHWLMNWGSLLLHTVCNIGHTKTYAYDSLHYFVHCRAHIRWWLSVLLWLWVAIRYQFHEVWRLGLFNSNNFLRFSVLSLFIVSYMFQYIQTIFCISYCHFRLYCISFFFLFNFVMVFDARFVLWSVYIQIIYVHFDFYSYSVGAVAAIGYFLWVFICMFFCKIDDILKLCYGVLFECILISFSLIKIWYYQFSALASALQDHSGYNWFYM